jgi:starch synthase
MHIIMAASEAIPFAKTGGLADVCGTLPRELAKLGHHCSLFMPGYRKAKRHCAEIHDTHISFVIDMAGKPMTAHVLKTQLPSVDAGGSAAGSPVDVYFIDQPFYFDRDDLYGDSHGDYRDNCERFSFFSRAVVEAIDRLRFGHFIEDMDGIAIAHRS